MEWRQIGIMASMVGNEGSGTKALPEIRDPFLSGYYGPEGWAAPTNVRIKSRDTEISSSMNLGFQLHSLDLHFIPRNTAHIIRHLAHRLCDSFLSAAYSRHFCSSDR